MRLLRSASLLFCATALLVACEQAPDVVLRSEALQDGGGDASSEDDAGMDQDASTLPPLDPNCDPRAAATYGLLSGVARDDCRFEVNDQFVSGALDSMFFNQPLPAPQGETRPPSVCDFVLTVAYPDPNESGYMILCPGYCALLNVWLDDNEQLFRDCLSEP